MSGGIRAAHHGPPGGLSVDSHLTLNNVRPNTCYYFRSDPSCVLHRVSDSEEKGDLIARSGSKDGEAISKLEGGHVSTSALRLFGMNLFCFTLDGSTESIYEASHSQTVKDVLPKYQSSPGLHRPEWGGSDPDISPHSRKAKRNNRSRVPESRSDRDASDRDVTSTCWTSSADQTELSRHMKDVLCSNNPALTCIGKSREKQRSQTTPSPRQPDVQGVPAEGDVWSPWLGNYLWSPLECPQPWTPFTHSCHQPQHHPLACAGALTLPRMREWEGLTQEVDGKRPQKCPPPMIRSITDLQLSQTTLTRFGRFDAFGQPSMKPQDNGESNPTLQMSHACRKHVEAFPQRTQTAIMAGNTPRDEAETKREVGGGFCRRSRNSVESLCSLTSGQSSSSGVTSGSGCSSNRDSLRLEDQPLDTRQLRGRARVHTEFVPSPYDTESLRLKVGDVIDIMADPPMGIWTGVLNGRMGNFKFIYVDVLTEESPDTQIQKSTVQEMLRRLSLEEYFSSLQLHGYQTVDDLMKLREQHLTEMNVTDPEHRHRLLAAIDSLQQLCCDSQSENEGRTSRQNNCPRDSGCHTDDTDFIYEYQQRRQLPGHNPPAGLLLAAVDMTCD